MHCVTHQQQQLWGSTTPTDTHCCSQSMLPARVHCTQAAAGHTMYKLVQRMTVGQAAVHEAAATVAAAAAAVRDVHAALPESCTCKWPERESRQQYPTGTKSVRAAVTLCPKSRALTTAGHPAGNRAYAKEADVHTARAQLHAKPCTQHQTHKHAHQQQQHHAAATSPHSQRRRPTTPVVVGVPPPSKSGSNQGAALPRAQQGSTGVRVCV
jgi:hypothetical protein